MQKTKYLRDAKLNEKTKGVVFREKFHACLPSDRKAVEKPTKKPPKVLPPIKTTAVAKATEKVSSKSLPDRYDDIRSTSSTLTYLNSLNGPRPILKNSNNSNSSNKNSHHNSSPPVNFHDNKLLSKKLRFDDNKRVLRSKSVNFCRINSSIRYFTRHIEIQVFQIMKMFNLIV